MTDFFKITINIETEQSSLNQRDIIIMININKFDYVYPPDLAKAKLHRQACRIFKQGESNRNNQKCQCCDKRIGNDQVQTSCNIDPVELSFLGPGVPLFFLFLKLILVLLGLMVIIFVGFSIFSNVTSSDCQNLPNCISDGFTILSIINKSNNTLYLSIQSYISLGFVVITILFFHYLRLKSRQLKQICDQSIDSPSDYAIILRRLPEKITEDDIKNMIQTQKNELKNSQEGTIEEIKIVKIILSYSLRQYITTIEENKEQFEKYVKQDRLKQFTPKPLPPLNQSSRFAVVVFENQSTKDLFIYKPNFCQRFLQFFCGPCVPMSDKKIKDQRIGIERAPEPDDIYWHNSGITMMGALCRKISFGLIGILILCLGGATQYGLQLAATSTTDQTTKFIIGFLNSVAVTVFNLIINITLQITTKKQRAQTQTEFQAVLMVKITLAQFFNAGIFVIMAEIATSYSTFSLQNGIISQITLIMIMDAIIPNALVFFLNYFEIIQGIKRYLILKNYIIGSQRELNNLYIGPPLQIHNKYAYILKTLWLTAVYAPMIPIVVAIALVGLTLNYFIQKILITKCYSMPNTISSMTFQSAMQLLQYFLIAFSIGEFIVYCYFYNYQISSIPLDWTITIFLTIALSVMNSAIPMQAINKALFKVEQSARSALKYSEVLQKFEVTYEMSNPAYKSQKRKEKDKNNSYYSNQSQSQKEQNQLKQMLKMSTASKNLGMNKPLLGENESKTKRVQNPKYKDNVNNKLIGSKNQRQGRNQAKKKQQLSQKKQPLEIEMMNKKMQNTTGKQILNNGTIVNNNTQKNMQNKLQMKIGQSPIIKINNIVQQNPYPNSPNWQNSQNNQSSHPKMSNQKQYQRQNKEKQSNIQNNSKRKSKQKIDDRNIKNSKHKNEDKHQKKFQKEKTSFIANYQPYGYEDSYLKMNDIQSNQKKSSFYSQNNYKTLRQQQDKMKKYLEGTDSGRKFKSNEQELSEMTERQLIKKMKKQENKKSKFRYLNIKTCKNKIIDYDGLLSNDIKNEQIESMKSNLPIGAQLLNQTNNKVDHHAVNQSYRSIFRNMSDTRSISSVVPDQNHKHTTFDDPLKQKKATYDPIKLSTSYKAFFNDKEAMKQRQGSFLNKQIIRSFISNPFTQLVKKEKEISQNQQHL